MKTNTFFRSYYLGIYVSLRLLYKWICNCSSLVVIQVQKKWSSKLDRVLDEECGALERYKEEIVVRQAREAWLELVNVDDLGDRNQWRTVLPPLPSWRQKGKRHAGKRQGNNLASTI